MHTTVHAPRTKDHTLIFGPKNQRVIILSGHSPKRVADVETLYACTVAESILTLPRAKKAWNPKIGGNDLELAQWSSHLPVRNGTRAVLRTRIQTAMFTCGVVQVVTVLCVTNPNYASSCAMKNSYLCVTLQK